MNGASVLQSASTRNPPCGACKIASGARAWNCAGPRAASNWSPKLPKGCIPRRYSRRFRIRRLSE
eukprot:9517673-Alexandrium_andersonii.AAC.1